MGDPSNYYSNAIPQSRPSKCTLVIQFYRFHGKLRILSALEIIAFSTGREYNSQFILFRSVERLSRLEIDGLRRHRRVRRFFEISDSCNICRRLQIGTIEIVVRIIRNLINDSSDRSFIGRSIRFQNHQRFIVIVILYRLEFAIGVLGSVSRIILCTGLITPLYFQRFRKSLFNERDTEFRAFQRIAKID